MIGMPPSARGREAPDDVAAAGRQRRRGVVLVHLGAQRAQLGAHQLGHAALLARRRGDLAQAHHQPGHLGQPGEILRLHPPSARGLARRPGSRAPACSAAAPTNSRNSGCGRVGRLLNSGWNCDGAEPGVLGQLDDLDEAPVGRAAADDAARRSSSCSRSRRVDLVAVAVALVDRRPGRRRPRARACPSTRWHGSAPRRMVPPRSSIGALLGHQVDDRVRASRGRTRWSWRRPSPQTWRANSMTAICMPRQMPRNGMPRSRAKRVARDLALDAAAAEAAGHQDAVAPASRRRVLEVERPRRRPSRCSSFDAVVRWPRAQRLGTDRYASWSWTYLPTRAIRTLALAGADALDQRGASR